MVSIVVPVSDSDRERTEEDVGEDSVDMAQSCWLDKHN